MDAAENAGRDPDRVSFVAALRISRRSIAQQGAFPPWHSRHRQSALASRHRRAHRPAPAPTTTSRQPRVVKRKYTKWHVKRSRHHNWPQPNRLPEQAVVI